MFKHNAREDIIVKFDMPLGKVFPHVRVATNFRAKNGRVQVSVVTLSRHKDNEWNNRHFPDDP
jgi:hypothetical protein